MRRPPITCRRAVQSLQIPAPQHIWIPDELLSSTLHRFFRNSCPQQRRNGSHVPGPLEARRRATKRRMTVSADFFPQDSLPPSFNLGALFRFRSHRQPSWKYEPPTLQTAEQALESAWQVTDPAASLEPSEARPTSAKHTKSSSTVVDFSHNMPYVLGEQNSVMRLGAEEEETAISTALSDATQPAHAEEHARVCVEAFKLRISGATELAHEERNTIIGEAFRDCCSASADTSMYTAWVIRHMVELGCDPVPVLQEHSYSSFAVADIQSPEWISLLLNLEKLMEAFPHCVHHVHQVHIRLAESVLAASASSLDPQSQDRRLMLLVRQLWQTAHLQGAEFEESAADLLRAVVKKLRDAFSRRRLSAMLKYTTKAEGHLPGLIRKAEENLPQLSTVADVLLCLPRERLHRFVPFMTCDIAKAVNTARKSDSQSAFRMHVWLQLLHHVDQERASSCSPLVDDAMAALTEYVFGRDGKRGRGIRILLSAVVENISQTGTFDGVSMSQVSESLLAFQTPEGHGGSTPADTAFDLLLAQLKNESLPQEPVAQQFLNLVARHAGLKFTVPFLEVLAQRRLRLAEPALLRQLVATELASIQSSTKVTEKDRQKNAFALHVCRTTSKLLDSLSSIPTLDTVKSQLLTLQSQRQLAHILVRANIDHSLPLAYRHVAADMSVQDSVHLIHQLAHQYSTDHALTHLEAWRAVYYLYQYLQRNSLYIGPLFSKAVVRIAIIRPISDNRFVSSRRVVWVCRLVARVEGEAVAKQIEANFWTWRGNLLKYAKTVHIGAGGHRHDKPHVGTLNKLGLL